MGGGAAVGGHDRVAAGPSDFFLDRQIGIWTVESVERRALPRRREALSCRDRGVHCLIARHAVHSATSGRRAHRCHAGAGLKLRARRSAGFSIIPARPPAQIRRAGDRGATARRHKLPCRASDGKPGQHEPQQEERPSTVEPSVVQAAARRRGASFRIAQRSDHALIGVAPRLAGHGRSTYSPRHMCLAADGTRRGAAERCALPTTLQARPALFRCGASAQRLPRGDGYARRAGVAFVHACRRGHRLPIARRGVPRVGHAAARAVQRVREVIQLYLLPRGRGNKSSV